MTQRTPADLVIRPAVLHRRVMSAPRSARNVWRTAATLAGAGICVATASTLAVQAHGEPRPDESAATVSAAADRAAAVRVTVERASRSAARPLAGHGDPRGIAAALMAQRHGWGGGQLACLSSLWGKESTWDVHAENPVSGAYGIPQALPGSKMSSAGSQWRDDPATQITWGLDYIHDTYGSPCGAWDSFRSQGWY